MRYFFVHGGTGYCGCDFEDVFECPDEVTEAEVDQITSEMALDNGEIYEYVASGWEEEFETEQDRDDYYAGCWCDWEEITKEQYDCYKETGDFEE